MRALATWCVRNRRLTLALWVLTLVAVFVASRAAGTTYRDTFTLNGTDSVNALNLIKAAAPAAAGDQDQIVLHTDSGTLTDPAVQARVTAMLDHVATLPHVSSVQSPYGPLGAAQISTDGKTAFARVTFDEQGNLLPKK